MLHTSPEISVLLQKILDFRDARDWGQFHTLKNLVSAISVECAELVELTQWKSTEELEDAVSSGSMTSEIASEIADIFIYLLLICEKTDIDPIAAANAKVTLNEERYPRAEFKGSSRKYSK